MHIGLQKKFQRNFRTPVISTSTNSRIEPRRMDWWRIRLVVKPSNFQVASLNSRIYMLLPEAPFSFSTPKDCLSSLWMRSRHPFKIMRRISATKDSELLADEHLDGKIDKNFNCLGSMRCKVLSIKHLIFGLLLWWCPQFADGRWAGTWLKF